MNIEKAQAKMGTAHDIGCRLDDSREAYLKEVSQWEGSNGAALQIAKGIEDLAKHVDKDMDEGQYDLATATLVKKYLTRAATVAQAVGAQASQQALMAKGRVQAAEAGITLVRKIHDEEAAKVQAFRQAVASGQVRIEEDGTTEAAPGVNIPGVRPGMSIKEQRLAEEKAAQRPAPPAEAPPMPPAEAPPAPPEKKRGGRGKRASNP